MDGDEKRRLMLEDGKVWPMVMSVGYNPYFKNEKVTAVSSDSLTCLSLGFIVSCRGITDEGSRADRS